MMSSQLEQAHAPSVDSHWAESFVREASIRDVPGSAIATTLDEVEHHVAVTGESARTAFGDPVTYAEEIAETALPAPLARLVGAIGPVLMQLLGLLLIFLSLTRPWTAGEVPITLGTIAGGLLIAVLWLTLAIPRTATWIFRGLMSRPIISVVSVLVFLGVIFVAATLPGVYTWVSTTTLIIIANVLIVLGTVWGMWRVEAQQEDDAATSNESTRAGTALVPYLIIPAISLIIGFVNALV